MSAPRAGVWIRHPRGFTLIELLVVIAIIGILVAAASGMADGEVDNLAALGY